MNHNSSTPDETETIFCTPENKEYYSALHYESLHKTRKEIRLVKVLASDDSPGGVIQCELHQNIPLDDVRNKFTALSYCAGSAQNTKPIIVNGHTCNVFANLHHALIDCRHFWSKHHPGNDFFLWTDQICIYQPDQNERAHQVGFMGEIYRSAKQTLICLATQDCDSRGFEWIEEVLKLPLQGPFDVSDETFQSGWLKFLDIVTSPWWSRAWVFQEFILSRRPIFIYGCTSMAWDEFDMKLEKVFGYLRVASFAGKYQSQEYSLSLHGVGKIKILFQKSNEAENQVNRFLTRKDEFTIFSSEERLVDHRGTEAVRDHFRPTSDFKSLLLNAHRFCASDERDKIYAFLGLTDFPHGVVPSYSDHCRAEQLSNEVTQRIIEHEKNIKVLKYASNSIYPSWSVPWTRLHPPKIEGRVTIPDRFIPKDWQADAHIGRDRFSPHLVLTVWGVPFRPERRALTLEARMYETWILYGLKVPVFLLRLSYGSSRKYFRLIGPAEFEVKGTVVDCMTKVFQELGYGELRRQRISIV